MPLGIPAPQGVPLRPLSGGGLGSGNSGTFPVGNLPAWTPQTASTGLYKTYYNVNPVYTNWYNTNQTRYQLGDAYAASLRAQGMRANPSSWAVPDSAKLLQGQVANIQLQNDIAKQGAAQNYYWQMALLNAQRRAAGAGGGTGYMVKYANDTYNNQLAQDLLAFQNASRQLQGSATMRGAITSRGYANDLSAAGQAQRLADEQAKITRDRQLGAAAQGAAAAGAAASLIPIQQQALTAAYQQSLLNGDVQSAQAIYQVLGGAAAANGGILPGGVSIPASLSPSVAPVIPKVTTRKGPR